MKTGQWSMFKTLLLILVTLAAVASFGGIQEATAEETVTIQKLQRRPLLGVQRWDMFSGKGATQQKELGYLPGKKWLLERPPMARSGAFLLSAD